MRSGPAALLRDLLLRRASAVLGPVAVPTRRVARRLQLGHAGLQVRVGHVGDPIPSTMRRYGMQGTPTLLLIDRVGRLRRQTFGHIPDLQFGAGVISLVREDAPAIAGSTGNPAAFDAATRCDAEVLRRFAGETKPRRRKADGAYRRHHIQALAQRVEVGLDEIRITGSRAKLLGTRAGAGPASPGVSTAGTEVRSFVPNWLPGLDSNQRPFD